MLENESDGAGRLVGSRPEETRGPPVPARARLPVGQRLPVNPSHSARQTMKSRPTKPGRPGNHAGQGTRPATETGRPGKTRPGPKGTRAAYETMRLRTRPYLREPGWVPGRAATGTRALSRTRLDGSQKPPPGRRFPRGAGGCWSTWRSRAGRAGRGAARDCRVAATPRPRRPGSPPSVGPRTARNNASGQRASAAPLTHEAGGRR